MNLDFKYVICNKHNVQSVVELFFSNGKHFGLTDAVQLSKFLSSIYTFNELLIISDDEKLYYEVDHITRRFSEYQLEQVIDAGYKEIKPAFLLREAKLKRILNE